MNKIILLLIFASSFLAHANGSSSSNKTSVNVMKFVQSPLAELSLPAIFVWNDKQKPTYFHSGQQDYEKTLTDILQGIDTKIDNQTSFDFIKDHLISKNKWNDEQQVIVFVSFDKSLADCPPCEVANELINKHEEELHKQFATINLAVVNK